MDQVCQRCTEARYFVFVQGIILYFAQLLQGGEITQFSVVIL